MKVDIFQMEILKQHSV